MKSLFHKTLARPGAITALVLAGVLFGGAAHAAGTASGTSITNLANLTYSVGGTTQSAIGSSATGNTAGAGTATAFLVDNKVNLLVTETGNAVTSVVPGAVDRVTTFTVTNLGNTAQGYTLVAANQLAGSAVIAATADSIDVSNFRVFVDANGNGIYDAGTDTATAILSLAADASVTVFVLADIPAAATNLQQANITLTATTTTAGTATPVVATAGADTAGVDIVFADAATTELAFVGTSAARDGQATARDAYRIASAVISVSKTSTLVCDPFNGDSTGNPKNIPGAIVRWTITISNAAGASASATLAQVTDTLNTNTTFDTNLVTGAGAPATASSCTSAGGTPESVAGSGFKIDVTGDTRTGTSGTFPRFLTTGANADGATHSGGLVTIDYSQALPAGAGGYSAGELKPGESVIVYFNVTIN